MPVAVKAAGKLRYCIFLSIQVSRQYLSKLYASFCTCTFTTFSAGYGTFCAGWWINSVRAMLPF